MLAQSHTVTIHPFNQARWFIIVDFTLVRVPSNTSSSASSGTPYCYCEDSPWLGLTRGSIESESVASS